MLRKCLFAGHLPRPEAIERLTTMTKFGLPSYEALRIRQGFILSYDRGRRNANWVLEHLTSDMSQEGAATRAKSRFSSDDSVHGYFRTRPADFRGSGYDRGHLAAADHHRQSQPDLDDTFVLTNIAPQNENLNRGTWKRLETHVRNLVRKYGSVYVCSGPLYLPREISGEKENEILQILEGDQRKRRKPSPKKYVIYEVIGANNVAVPTHFFKVVVMETEGGSCYDMEAYVVPNGRSDTKRPLSTYMVPRDAVERAAGFLLFHQLPSTTLRYINGEESLRS